MHSSHQSNKLTFTRAQSHTALAPDKACNKAPTNTHLSCCSALSRAPASGPISICDGLHDDLATVLLQWPIALKGKSLLVADPSGQSGLRGQDRIDNNQLVSFMMRVHPVEEGHWR